MAGRHRRRFRCRIGFHRMWPWMLVGPDQVPCVVFVQRCQLCGHEVASQDYRRDGWTDAELPRSMGRA